MSELKIQTDDFEIVINAGQADGYFERNSDGDGGGLWFAGNELVDYDGVYALHPQVAKALRDNGFIVDWTCVAGETDPDETEIVLETQKEQA